VQAKQNEKLILYIPSTGKRSAISGKAGLHHTLMVTWEDKQVTPSVPSLPLLPPAFTAQHDIIWCGIALWSAGLSCPSCVPFPTSHAAQPTCWWDRASSRQGFD